MLPVLPKPVANYLPLSPTVNSSLSRAQRTVTITKESDAQVVRALSSAATRTIIHIEGPADIAGVKKREVRSGLPGALFHRCVRSHSRCARLLRSPSTRSPCSLPTRWASPKSSRRRTGSCPIRSARGAKPRAELRELGVLEGLSAPISGALDGLLKPSPAG
jgi:hypothetical protein